jgi:integral membrane sensor domain MASE1
VNDDTVGAIAPGISMGALVGVMLLRRVLTTEAQWDRRWILLVLAAVVVAAFAGIMVGSLLDPN